MNDLQKVAEQLTGLAGVAVRSFLATLALLTLAGVALAAGSYYLLREYPVYGGLAAALAVVEGVAAGVLLGGRRAGLAALAHGLRTWRLGAAAVRLVFDRLPVGTAATVGRLPLAQAEAALATAIGGLIRSRAEGGGLSGWFRRMLQGRLAGLVQRVTLARFRQGGASAGVDLASVRGDLEARIDDLLVAKLSGGLRLWTLLAVGGLLVLAAVQVALARALLAS